MNKSFFDGLQVEQVSQSFIDAHKQRSPVLQGVDLTVATGEIVALQGPSGCGKSTLLRVIAGLEPVEAGTVVWRGVGPKPQYRRIDATLVWCSRTGNFSYTKQ